MSTPLPSPDRVPAGLQRNAFTVIKGLEARSDGKAQTLARMLGWLLIHLPTDKGKQQLATDILWCLIPAEEDGDDDIDLLQVPLLPPDFDYFGFHERDRRLCEFGRSMLDHLIGVFNRTGPTPAPSTHSSRTSFQVDVQHAQDNLQPPNRTYRTSKQQALVRDGYGCAISKLFQDRTGEDIKHDIRQRFPDFGPGLDVITNACHIIPQGLSSDTYIAEPPASNRKRDWAANASAVLSRYTSVKLMETLNGSDIHRLENIITLSNHLHGLFDSLRFCLEPTNEDNVYRIWCPNNTGYEGARHGGLITLVNRSPPHLQEQYPLPGREYLRLHAVCCRVAHLSAAGEYVEEILDDLNDTRVLAQDGGSKELLASALARIAIH